MATYLAKRTLMGFATVVAAILIAFVLIHLSPGSPGELVLGAGATKTQIAAENAKLGWSEPLLTQLWDYFHNLFRGHLGTSMINGQPVGQDLIRRLPVTASIAVMAAIISTLCGVVLGVTAAVRGGAVDRFVNSGSGIGLSLPSYWLAVLLVYLLSIKIHLLPATGYVSYTQSVTGWLTSIALPTIAMACGAGAFVARTTRVSMAAALDEPYIHMLESLGEPPARLLFVHALRTASVPIISVVGVQFIVLFGGTIIIENLFALPGLGQAASNAVSNHDFPMVEGVVLISSLLVVAVNLVLDLVLALVDPRVRGVS